jgi:F-type H+-transporting ATPase subunit a
VTSDQTAAIEQPPPKGGRSRKLNWGLLLVFVLFANIAAFILVPPFDREHPDEACAYPICFIEGTLEFPNPYEIWNPADYSDGLPLIQFHPSITSSILTMLIISVLLFITIVLMTRKRDMIPGKAQNAIEGLYDGLAGFATSLGGAGAKPYIPLFVVLFIYILASNWSGLLPFVGRIHEFRAPTSDVNITIGLALVAFAIFHIEGVRALGVGGYLSKFFPFREFKNGVGAGIIALFVGLVELMLEFVKPLTLSMRLFGNVYGGEVALGVILALTIAIVPVFIYGLELMLNAVQALIFSVLTLMFILAAIEGHHDEHEAEHEPADPVGTPVGPDTLDRVATAN